VKILLDLNKQALQSGDKTQNEQTNQTKKSNKGQIRTKMCEPTSIATYHFQEEASWNKKKATLRGTIQKKNK
jgi:hypothetical protein